MAQFHLLHHWIFPRAGDGAKQRAIITIRSGAPLAQMPTRIPLLHGSALPSATLAVHRSGWVSDRKAGKGWRDLIRCTYAFITAIAIDGVSAFPCHVLGTQLGTKLRPLIAMQSLINSLAKMCDRFAYSVHHPDRSRNLEMARYPGDGGSTRAGGGGGGPNLLDRPIIDLSSHFRGGFSQNIFGPTENPALKNLAASFSQNPVRGHE
jgi:hypothetical protein